VELAAGKRVEVIQQAGTVDFFFSEFTTIDAGDDICAAQALILVEHSVDVAIVDAPALKIFAVSFMGQVAAGAGDPARFGNRVGKVQVLEAMQGVVMHEVPDRGLAGKNVFQMLDSLEQLFADILFLTVCAGRIHE